MASQKRKKLILDEFNALDCTNIIAWRWVFAKHFDPRRQKHLGTISIRHLQVIRASCNPDAADFEKITSLAECNNMHGGFPGANGIGR